jgi:Helix-turn-helix domain
LPRQEFPWLKSRLVTRHSPLSSDTSRTEERLRLKIRIDPDEEQARFLDRQFGAVRFVFNTALAIKRHWYEVRGDRLSAKHDLKPLLAIAKRSRRYGWLAGFDVMPCSSDASTSTAPSPISDFVRSDEIRRCEFL